MGLFGKEPKKDPKAQVREWSAGLRKENRALDRQIRTIKTEEAKVNIIIMILEMRPLPIPLISDKHLPYRDYFMGGKIVEVLSRA